MITPERLAQIKKANGGVYYPYVAELIQSIEEMRETLTKIIEGFDGGIFVLDTRKDSQPDWAIKLLPFIIALGEAAKLTREKETKT